jgi:hypothetical protein
MVALHWMRLPPQNVHVAEQVFEKSMHSAALSIHNPLLDDQLDVADCFDDPSEKALTIRELREGRFLTVYTNVRDWQRVSAHRVSPQG